ncbi:MAG: hypothetical protein ACTSU5_03025 [Promethearchaeota archaeon]
MIEALEEHLTEAKDWEKMETDIPGVFVVKIPATKTRPAKIMIEVNPVDETGKPKKRKGLFISDFEMYVQFLEALEDDRIGKLIKVVDSVNPQNSSNGTKKKLKIE